MVRLIMLSVALAFCKVSALPNLTPYQPSGWDDKIVVSNVSNTTTSYTGHYQGGQTVYICIAWENNGDQDAPLSVTSLYYDNTIIVHEDVSTLSAGSYRYVKNISYKLPASTAGGLHYFKLVVDDMGNVGESNGADNEYSRSVYLDPTPLPDLIVTNTSVTPASVNPGGQVTVSCVVRNAGSGPAGVSRLGYYFPENTYVSDDYVSSLDGGATSSESEVITIPSSTSPGTYRIKFVCDYQDAVDETDEQNNNDEYVTITVTPVTVDPPDLVIINPAVLPANILAGDQVTVTCAVVNQGTGDAATSRIGYYFPDNTLIADVLVASMVPGQTINKSTSFIIPAGTSAGSQQIKLVADYLSAVTESNESNNEVNADFTVMDRFEITPSVKGITCDMGNTVFGVRASVPWSVSDDADWLTAVKADNATINVSYSVNIGSTRTATITIVGGGGVTDKAILTQSGGCSPVIDRFVKPEEREGIVIEVQPNPFRDRTEIRYVNLRNGEPRIVDLYGNLVKGITMENTGAGMVSWDGCDDQNRQVTPGVYFLVTGTSTGNQVVKIIRTK